MSTMHKRPRLLPTMVLSELIVLVAVALAILRRESPITQAQTDDELLPVQCEVLRVGDQILCVRLYTERENLHFEA